MLCYRELFGFVEEVDGERIRRLASDDEDDALPVKRAKVWIPPYAR